MSSRAYWRCIDDVSSFPSSSSNPELTLSPALIVASQSRPAPPTRAPSLDYFNHRFTTQSSTSPYDVRTPLASSYRSRRDAPIDPGNYSPKSSWTNLTGLFNSSVMALRSPGTTPSGTPRSPSFGAQLSPPLAGTQQGRGSSSRSPTRLVRGVSDSPESSRTLAARQAAQTRPMMRGMSSSPALGIPSVAVIRESPRGSISAPVPRKRIVVKFSDPQAFSFVH